MKLKCSNVLAKELNKKSKYSITCVSMNEKEYSLYVDLDSYLHENDYNYNTELFRVIKVEYPPEYYALPQYITTNDLYKMVKGLKEITLNSVCNAFNELVEI